MIKENSRDEDTLWITSQEDAIVSVGHKELTTLLIVTYALGNDIIYSSYSEKVLPNFLIHD